MLSPARAIKAESTTLRRAGGVGALPYRRCSTGDVRGSPIGSLRGVGIVWFQSNSCSSPPHFLSSSALVFSAFFEPLYLDRQLLTFHSSDSALPRDPIQSTVRRRSSPRLKQLQIMSDKSQPSLRASRAPRSLFSCRTTGV